MIYTDGTHLVADSRDELHTYAKRIGLKKCWYHFHILHPHYDMPNYIKLIVSKDTKVNKVRPREVLEISRRLSLIRTKD